MKKMMAAVFCLALVFTLVGCSEKTAGSGAPIAGGANMPVGSEVADTEKTGDTTEEHGVDMTQGLIAVDTEDKQYEEPGTDEYIVMIAKTRDDLINAVILPESETVIIANAIAKSESENAWANDISRCAPSCVMAVVAANEKTLYHYCEYGVLDDTENVKSLELTEESKNAVNEILSKYDLLNDAVQIEDTMADAVNAETAEAEYDISGGDPLAPEEFTKP